MHDSVYTHVCNTLADHLEISPSQIKPDHDLRNHFGLDSVALHVIAALLEEEEEIEIREEDLALVNTVGQLIRLVRALRARSLFEVHLLEANDAFPGSRRRPRGLERPSSMRSVAFLHGKAR